MPKPSRRLRGVTALSILAGVGSLIAAVSAVSLAAPGSFLEPMWRLNPRAHDSFVRISPFAIPLLATVSVACAIVSVGLWRNRIWAYWLAVTGIAINAFADLLNFLIVTEPRAIVGVPIALAILVYLLRPKVRASFGHGVR